MFSPFSLYVGWRYTRSQRGNLFISFISLVSMLGLMLGVAALILVLSVMNGFDRELKQRILGMVPQAVINGYQGPIQEWGDIRQQLLGAEGVEGVAPYTQAQGMLSANGQVQPVMVSGIIPTLESSVSIAAQQMTEGSLDQLEAGEYRIVLGELLARFLAVKTGDKVNLILPEASVSVAGIVPRMKRFTVAGIFSVGAELDASLAYIHLSDAARLKRFAPDSAEGIRIKFSDLFAAPARVRELARDLSLPVYTSDWTRTHGNLFQAIQLEKRMIGLLLFLIVFVAAFNIVSTLVMVVTDKRSDIAILRTLGATPGTILRIFMIQGSLIGMIGTFLGSLLGVILALTISDLVAWVEQQFGIQFLSSEVYFISYLPSELQSADLLMVVMVTLAISFTATIYPAWRASRVQPAEALRYE